MPLKVEVTNNDIEKAQLALPYFVENMSHHCPVFNALERQMPHRSITVCYDSVMIDCKRYKATPRFEGVIQRYMLAHNWVPTTFEIEAI